MIEVEVKLPVSFLGSSEWDAEMIGVLMEKLLEMGFVSEEHILEEDTYYDTADGSIRKSGQAFRIRQIEDKHTGKIQGVVTFKGKRMDKETLTRQEFETLVGDPAVFHQLLLALGFSKAKPVVRKERRILKKENISACLDRVKDLGDFLELEIMAEEESKREEAVRDIEAALNHLGYSLEDTVKTSYLSMLQCKLQ